MDAKAALRERMLAARRSAPAERLAEAGAAVAAHAVPVWSLLRVVAGYAAVAGEPPTQPLLDGLYAAGVDVVLPVVHGADLDWAAYEGWGRLVPADHGLLEPNAPRRGPSSLLDGDLVVVPALAVDRHGNRLGRGAGYYDRALAGVRPRPPVVALVYAEELLDAVPTERHDVPVDAVLTPAGLFAVERRDGSVATVVPGAVRLPG